MKNFIDTVLKACSSTSSNYSKSSLKVLAESTRPKFVVGKNTEAIEIIKRFNITGLIDDTCTPGTTWRGIPVFKTKDIDKHAVVVNCSTSIYPITVSKALKSAGIDTTIEYSTLVSDKDGGLPYPWFVTQQKDEILRNKHRWSELYDRMEDQTSRDTLLSIIMYRLTSDLRYMENFEVRLLDQYFEEFMKYDGEYFVDGGGYNGDTTAEFACRSPNYNKIYFFEPSRKNISEAMTRLRAHRDIEFKNIGLSDKDETLYFDENAGSASAVVNGTGTPIRACALDNELGDEPVTFIKLDLEGWEMRALRGAAKIISQKKPKLAVAVYHAAKDFREVPSFILNLNPGYKVYLRHYTQGWSESVMYFC